MVITYLPIMKFYALEAWFSGTVQGVGFRYTVMHLAKGFEVVGEVKNLSDGRVYVQAQGSETEVKAFKAAIEEEMGSYIKETDSKLNPVEKKTYSDFMITSDMRV